MPVLPAILEPENFISESGKYWPRGFTLKLLDGALKEMWEQFNGASPDAQLTIVCDVLRCCDWWLRAKHQGKAEGGNKVMAKIRGKIAASRLTAVQQVGDAALTVLYELHPEFKTRITYERTKFHALLGDRTAKTKKLDAGFDNERQVYVSKKKAENPPAAGLVNKTHTAVKDGETVFGEDQYKKLKPLAAVVVKSAVNKRFAELQPLEFDAIAKYADQLGLQPVKKVGYLRRADRVKYMVFVHDNGNLFRYDAQAQKDVPFDTAGVERIFVIDKYRMLYSSHDGDVFPSDVVLHHSSFVAGNDVVFAGNWVVSYGVLTRVTNESGHYKPSRDDTHEAMATLFNLGVNLANCDLDVLYRDSSGPVVEKYGNNVHGRNALSDTQTFAMKKSAPANKEPRPSGRM